MKLPDTFLVKMKYLLGDAYPQFLQSYEQPRTAGVRANSLKIQPETLKEKLPYLQENVPWARDGFYYDEKNHRPAKHPCYYAGLYYVQEPSAMLPAEMLHAEKGQRVLDLCAAPGGKSVQIASQIGREGLLVVNDIHPQRARVLLKNMERYGVTQAVVCNDTPEKLAKVFGGFFDKILIDAPCSGEGMFRKDPVMANNWSEQEVRKYAGWQADILKAVPALLRPQGEIVYSTCTFSREENEEQIEQFLKQHSNFELVVKKRLWPHMVKGEGHFAAKLVNQELKSKANPRKDCPEHGSTHFSKTSRAAIEEFSMQVWGHVDKWRSFLPKDGQIVERSGHIVFEHRDLPTLRGLKVLRSGWLLGVIEKSRFRPSQAYALGLPKEAAAVAVQAYRLSTDNETALYEGIRYLRGETIQVEGVQWKKGWHLVCMDGYPLGWAKGAGSILKNEYPPGWRWEDRNEFEDR
ncbi:RsmB/NOP family class I SAM-dependent RNA methyltransferase [Fodinisporobacter ferrooxydans]|uniref:RsmB/NOP family class I SAM-dependent RNA methyltransferase n=1 Tax=Fodinisporobacter ferrooxydans TaxID=2901836 RepID=A0ABY4CJL2_9BACL|nr:RsmB/NOP family class I SAM-dependent RNA methyltransferase [Alicyclobacillaceae bacterium MYW30-H2]